MRTRVENGEPYNSPVHTARAAGKDLEVDISDDGIIVLRKPYEMTERPNTLGLLTELPLQYIYVHSKVDCTFTDGSIDDSIKRYLRKLRLP